MPGFNIGTPDGPSNIAEQRRKHRWQFVVLGPAWDRQGLLYLKSASRPSFTFEEAVVHHDQEQIYLAGKQTWSEMTMSWYDVENSPDISAKVYSWLNTVVTVDNATVNAPSSYKVDAMLEMIGATGASTESWTMYGAWPKSVVWGDLSYEDSSVATCEATLRYDRAKRS